MLNPNRRPMRPRVYTGTAALTGTGSSIANLIGGLGADTLVGSWGIDTASYAAATSAVTVNMAGGLQSGEVLGDVFDSIEIVLGSAYADTLTGDAWDNTLKGGDGNDTLDGGLGTDTVSYMSSAWGVAVSLLTGSR